MKQIIYNAQTGETTFEEVPDVETPIDETSAEPSQEERLTAVEVTQGEIVDALAIALGVTL